MSRQPTTAFAHAVKLLSGRDKTRAQLRQALSGKGFSEEEIDEALRRVVELGYLDEAGLARRRAAAGLSDGWAGEALRAKLIAGGLEERTAADAIALAVAESGWRELDAARALLAKRRVEGPKALRLLASRGFSEDVVERLVGSG